jgi:SAM-dependent methyltransferase
MQIKKWKFQCTNNTKAMKEIPFDGNYWSKRYLDKETGWDLGGVATPLAAYFDQLENKNLKILIPGCGNAYEAEYLLSKGFAHITLLDISEVLVKSLQQKFAENPQIRVIEGDFFEHSGKYDLIIEQTFFCALVPSLRPLYAEKMAELLNANGKLVGLLFDKHFQVNPPFGGEKSEYIQYFEPYFDCKVFDACYNSVAPRQDTELFMIWQRKK